MAENEILEPSKQIQTKGVIRYSERFCIGERREQD